MDHQLHDISLPGSSDEPKVLDPVCGMTVDPATTKLHTEHAGTTYYFCSRGCLEKFKADPEKYLDASSAKADAGHGSCCHHGGGKPKTVSARGIVASGQYTCPMHPEIVRDGPGDCPICGMALEPMTVAASDEPNAELVDMTRRFWICAALTVPLVVLAMARMFFMDRFAAWFPGRTLPLVELALATPVVLWGGWPFFVRAWRSIENRSLNMFTLIGIGTGTAYA
jgi:Cu+-exporting ATPase